MHSITCLLVILVACGKDSGSAGGLGAKELPSKPSVDDACANGCKINGACSVTGQSTVSDEEFGSKGDVEVTRRNNNRCVPSKPEHCKASAWCKERGLCSLGKEECIIGTNEDCRGSDQCKEYGHCARDTDMMCTATSDADCAASAECAKRGHCVHKSGTHYSRTGTIHLCGPKSAADCMAAPYCKLKGFCKLVKPSGVEQCGPMSNADCEAAEECKTQGLCRLWVGSTFCATK